MHDDRIVSYDLSYIMAVCTSKVRKGDDLTTFTVPKVEKIRSHNLPDPQGPLQAYNRKTLPLPVHQKFLKLVNIFLIWNVLYVDKTKPLFHLQPVP
jgi:hypothetical protein